MGPVLPAAQFQVTDKTGHYLCMAKALAFESSVLAYNFTCNEAEWVPTWGLANDLTPGEEIRCSPRKLRSMGRRRGGLDHSAGSQLSYELAQHVSHDYGKGDEGGADYRVRQGLSDS